MCKHRKYIVKKMPTMTLAVPKELHEIIKKHNEVKWSEVARRAMWEYARKLEIMEKLTEDSKLTEKDVEEIDKAIKKTLGKHYPGKNEE